MSTKARLRRYFVEAPDSIGERARLRRANDFVERFADLASMDVLDLGGTLSYWDRLPVQPRSVTAVNPVGSGATTPGWYDEVIGDACEPPAEVAGRSFDLVYSNSTIEHVGDRSRRQRFADVVHACADRHWIQTPNRSFPIEPHVLFPLQQFLPLRGRALVVRYWPLVHTNSSTMGAALETAAATELVGRDEFSNLFPGSEIVDEASVSVLPAKSLIAVRVG